MSAGTSTPVAETLFQIYTYFMSRSSSDLPGGATGGTFPLYVYDKFGNNQAGNTNKQTVDPIQFACQKTFVIVVTDGLPSADTFVKDAGDPAVTDNGFSDIATLIGDFNGDGTPNALDDIAQFMQEEDFRPVDFADDQTVDVYTVGFATEGAASQLLRDTAAAGGGVYYHAQTGEELATVLNEALNDIVEKSQSFTAASVPSARTADGGDFYQSFFFPLGSTAFWEGHLRSWHITPDGSIVDRLGNCALLDPTPGECNSGPFDPSALFFWDSYSAMPLESARTNLWTSLDAGAGGVLTPFDQVSLSAADLDIDVFAAPSDPSPNSLLFPLKGSTAIDEEGLTDEVIAYARGCQFGTGAAANVTTPAACVNRVARLGDIFHSNPIVVRQPKIRRDEPTSYGIGGFYDRYKNRSRVIYAGANDGFLHGFDAGQWNTPAAPGTYSAGTGAEVMGFMPWDSRLEIKHKPVDNALQRRYYVDGSPQVADVWLPTNINTDNKLVSEWATVLVSGLRQGGREYFALDVSNPDGLVGGPTFPKYLWEFPRESDPDDANSPATSYLPWMGETWGTPVITRIKVQNTVDPLQSHERSVVIVTAGYSQAGNPNDPIFDLTAPDGYAGRGIFILDAKTGAVIAEKRLTAASTGDEADMLFAFASTPGVYDTDSDGYADVIFAPDLGGQIFKWVIRDPADLTNKAQPQWPFRKFFEGPSGAASGGTRYLNMFFPPSAAYVGGKLYIAIGTGERDRVGYAGDAGSLADNNWFYVIEDPDIYEDNPPVGQTPVYPTDLDDLTGINGSSTISGKGFRFMLQDGEKFVTNSEIFSGTVIVASFRPDYNGDPCISRGDGYLYAFSLSSGEGYFTDASANPQRTVHVGSGLPTDPKTSVGPDGKSNRVYVEKSDTELISFEAEDLNIGGNGVYWREKAQ